jgi:ribosomal protein L29
MAAKKADEAKKTVKKVEKKTAESVDYSVMSTKDLQKAIVQLREDLIVLKRGTVMGDVQNVRAYGKMRKELARALTILNVKFREEK